MSRLITLQRAGGYSTSSVAGECGVPFHREHASILIAIGSAVAYVTVPMQLLGLAGYVFKWEGAAMGVLVYGGLFAIGVFNALGVYVGARDIARRGLRATFAIGIGLNLAVAGLCTYMWYFSH